MAYAFRIQVALLALIALAAGWQFRQHRCQGEELAVVAAEAQAVTQELEARQSALNALEQRNAELAEAERRAGNQTLVALMKERAAATVPLSAAPSEPQSVGGALATVLGNAAQWETEREYLRNETRASMALFFKLTKLSPERIDQYIDLQIEMKRRGAERTAALLRGTLTVADAVRQRDRDRLEEEDQRRAVFGPEANAFFESIADGMRNDEAKRLLGAIQQNMGGNELNQEQRDRLQSLLKAELCTLPLDDTDLFRTPEDWTQIVAERQQNVLNGAGAFVAPVQLETLKALTAYDLSERQKQMLLKRKSLGLK